MYTQAKWTRAKIEDAARLPAAAARVPQPAAPRAIAPIGAVLQQRLRRLAPTLAPASLALVYVWFGAIKLIGASPATPLVVALQQKTLPMFEPATFLALLGAAEVAIGALFLVERLRALALALFALHMLATLLPLVVLPSIAWRGLLLPTLEGQYIIKNVALIALAVGIAAGFRPPADDRKRAREAEAGRELRER
ncbi:MAG TPA: hypothetical protein VEC18_06875 [Myxococcota bacterium]|nr:hypothetical protein [Myxococcota bacterium]